MIKNYTRALAVLHKRLEPTNYVEIGCRLGLSLRLSQAPQTLAVDPDFEIRYALRSPTRIFKETSDDFFAGHDLRALLGGPVDFAFIDGMHQAEFALRDFMNLEAASHPGGVIVIDDTLPQAMEHATRERNTEIWTGDIYKTVEVLRRHRPDLTIRLFDISNKGVCIVSGLDPDSLTLKAAYERIEQDIHEGVYDAPSIEVLRERLKPQPGEAFPAEANRLAEMRLALAPGRRPAAEPETPAGSGGANTERYLDLLKRSVLNEIYLDDELRIIYLRECLRGERTFDPAVIHDIRNTLPEDYATLQAARAVGRFYGRDIHNSGYNHTMLGRARLDSLHECLDFVRRDGIEGDLVEAGVWRGGACIFMAGYLRAHGMDARRIFIADSFEGLPAPTAPQDEGIDLSKDVYLELAVSQETVRQNFDAYGLLGDNLTFLQGWFKDTLPGAPIDKIALLRLDGDLYESTMDGLDALYDKVVPGGVVVIDDFKALKVCRQAVRDFFEARGQRPPKPVPIDWTGVYWRK